MISFLKKLFTIILLAGIYYVLERYMKITTAFKYIQFSYAHPVLNYASIILGPIVGAAASGLGEMLLYVGKDVPYDWVAIGCAALNCGVIGLSMLHSGVRDGFFLKKDNIRFNVTHLLSGLVFWAILYPIMRKFLMHVDFQEAMNYGFGRFIGMSIMNFIAGTLFLLLYARSRMTAANFYRN